MVKKRLKKKTLTNKDIRNEIEQIIKTKYDSFELDSNDDNLHLKGIFPIIDPENGSEIDRYEIEIEFPPGYPINIPILRETGGRIPRIEDRHINEKDGNACLFITEEGYRHLSQDPSVTSFLDGPVYQFLLSQSYYELTGNWLFGEWAHGEAGVYEYYSGLLKTENPNIILTTETILTFVEYLSKNDIKGHWRCYCSSGRKLKKCHLTFMCKIRNMIPPSIAKKSYQYLITYFETGKTNK